MLFLQIAEARREGVARIRATGSPPPANQLGIKLAHVSRFDLGCAGNAVRVFVLGKEAGDRGVAIAAIRLAAKLGFVEQERKKQLAVELRQLGEEARDQCAGERVVGMVGPLRGAVGVAEVRNHEPGRCSFGKARNQRCFLTRHVKAVEPIEQHEHVALAQQESFPVGEILGHGAGSKRLEQHDARAETAKRRLSS